MAKADGQLHLFEVHVHGSGVPVTFDRTVEPHRQVGSNRGVMFFGDVNAIKKDKPTVEG